MIGPDGRDDRRTGFEGLTQEEADERVVDWLKEHGQLEKRESYRHSVGTCERCHTRIEPLVSPQWWCRMDELAASGDRGARGAPRPLPPREPAPLRDRVARERARLVRLAAALVGPPDPDLDVPRRPPDLRVAAAEACAECGSRSSSARPTSSTRGSPRRSGRSRRSAGPTETPELERYYPGDVNVTAREIIRLWENRMIFSGLFLLGDIPFTDVIITSTVLAVDGRRMSKSLGTGIDPLEAVDKHGADATRYGLLKISSTQDVRFSLGRDRGGREAREQALERRAADPPERRGREPARRARRRSRSAGSSARIDDTRAEVEELLPAFDFAHVGDALYHLTFDDFCDWYAEAIKPRLYEGDEAAVATALAALERLLALLHPVMPHVTEEIWSQFHDYRG